MPPIDKPIVGQYTPRILDVWHVPGVGLKVKAEHACGHLTMNTFPHAPKRSSRQEVKGWIFGSPHAINYGICYQCHKAGAA